MASLAELRNTAASLRRSLERWKMDPNTRREIEEQLADTDAEIAALEADGGMVDLMDWPPADKPDASIDDEEDDFEW